MKLIYNNIVCNSMEITDKQMFNTKIAKKKLYEKYLQNIIIHHNGSNCCCSNFTLR